MSRSRMKSYHFDLGNSSTGPIGFCARIAARSKEEALQILRDALPDEADVRSYTMEGRLMDAVEYINVYFNPNAVSVRDIDEVDDGDDNE